MQILSPPRPALVLRHFVPFSFNLDGFLSLFVLYTMPVTKTILPAEEDRLQPISNLPLAAPRSTIEQLKVLYLHKEHWTGLPSPYACVVVQ